MEKSVFTFYVPETVALDRLTLKLDILDEISFAGNFIGTTGSIAVGQVLYPAGRCRAERVWLDDYVVLAIGHHPKHAPVLWDPTRARVPWIRSSCFLAAMIDAMQPVLEAGSGAARTHAKTRLDMRRAR